MASRMPLPVPPHTPTPPPEESLQAVGLGLENGPQINVEHESDGLTPMSATFPNNAFRNSSLNASSSLSTGQPSPATLSPYSPLTAGSTPNTASSNGSEASANPFNFQTQTYTLGGNKSPASKSDIGRRRGHKYKHSSVSHQIFLEPAPRAPLAVPASLPLPTFKEVRASMTAEQKMRFAWCICHLLVGFYVKLSAQGSTAMTALSHLVFYDFIGATVCCISEVGSNFECWKRTSLKRPFGFERFEVLAGLAMAVTLLFTGFDLVSHNLQHALESTGGHTPHHAHKHDRVSAGSVDTAALAAIVATLVSAIVLRNHERISKVMRFAYIESLPSVLSNPSHFLTLSCSTLLLLLPLLSITTYIWIDRAITAVIAISMVTLGWHMGWTLGKMLMMSYSGPGLANLLDALESDPAVTVVEEANIWQVHYGLCQANLKLRVRSLDDLARLRDRVASAVRNRLAGGYGSGGGQKWEISTQFTLETD